MGIGISVTGVAEAMQALSADKEKVARAMTQELARIGIYVEGKVKESIAGQASEVTSVDTGAFLNSVQSSVSSDTATHQQQAVIFTPLDYPQYLEYGTSRLAPRSHFRNTAFREEKNVQAMMQEAVKQAL